MAITLGALSACTTVGPDYSPPKPTVPDAWHQKLTKDFAEGQANLRTWWRTFKDPVLDSLIERATQGSLDLKVALARIKQARARLGVATGGRYPDIDAAGSFNRDRVSEGIISAVPSPQSRTDNFRSVGLDASWEIDFWGRIARNIESEDAGFAASVEDYRDTLVVLYADIAANYMDVRSLQARIFFAQRNVGTQRGSLQVARDRFEAKLAPELDVRQAELNLARTESVIPRLKRSLVAEINRLGVLLGELPSALHAELSLRKPIPTPPAQVLVGLPAELVRQRPDIRRAEREIALQTARVGVATADLYPRFSLSGVFAFDSASSGLFEGKNVSFSFGPAVRWNLFDGGRVRNAIRLEDARTQQAIVVYEQTVLNALEDVETRMVGYVQERERRRTLIRAVTAARRSVELVKELYRAGLTNFQNVFDTERELFEQEDALAESEGEVARQLVRIYRALGGGWQPDPAKLEQERKDKETKGEPIL